MDPNETLRLIEISTDTEECAEACETLYHWLLMGGFEPTWERYPGATATYRTYAKLEHDRVHARRQRQE